MKYISRISFPNPFDDYKFELHTIVHPIEKVNHLWRIPSFHNQYVHQLSIMVTQLRKTTNTVCRYVKCVKDCGYRERYIFDFNNNTLVVEATNTQQCICSLSMKVKHQTYDQIKTYFSECNENSTLTPTIIQEKLLNAKQNGREFCIPSKMQIKHLKHNMTRKVSFNSSIRNQSIFHYSKYVM